MTKQVSIHDLQVAAEWLGQYEDDGEEADNEASCKRVAEMLIKMAAEREFDSAAREIAKQTGAPLATARQRLRQVMRASR